MLNFEHNLCLFSQGRNESESNIKMLTKDIMLNIAQHYYEPMNQYFGPLNELEKSLEPRTKQLRLAASYYVPMIKLAIHELHNNPDFIAQLIPAWKHVKKAVPNTAIEILKTLFTDDSQFKSMVSYYCKDNPKLQAALSGLVGDLKTLVAQKLQTHDGDALFTFKDIADRDDYLKRRLGFPAGAKKFSLK